MTESVVLRRKAFRLPRHPASVGEARHRTGDHLGSWGHPAGSAIRDETVLIVSELAADTVLHGPRDEPDFEVAVTVLAHGSCLIEVSDGLPDEAVLPAPEPGPASRLPSPATPPDEILPGHARTVVSALSEAWGVRDRGRYGKTVWALATVGA
ncbi:ATP-binding protein [Streptomyces sp. NPDC058374]|uniref:ATP-binding protein n=1 Tax=unclassified Streptomyces TaxID=2593676 RepID=UPI00364C85A3